MTLLEWVLCVNIFHGCCYCSAVSLPGALQCVGYDAGAAAAILLIGVSGGLAKS